MDIENKKSEIFSRAVEVFEDPVKARRWFDKPCRALGGGIPGSLLDSLEGLHKVEDELERVEKGVYF